MVVESKTISSFLRFLNHVSEKKNALLIVFRSAESVRKVCFSLSSKRSGSV